MVETRLEITRGPLSSGDAPKTSIATLQVLRGVAAVAVAFYHVYIILMMPEYGANVIFQPVARFGFLGVSFFFVLSGFIIFMAHWRDIGNPSSVGTYIYKRLTRVYPAYWVYLTLFIIASAIGIGYPDFSWNIGNLISSYTLIPLVHDMTLPLKVAWTLVYEIRFYLFFILLLFFGARALWVFAAWGLAIFIFNLLGYNDVPSVLSLWNIYFLLGMVGFMLLDRIPSQYGVWIFGAGIFLFLAYAVIGSEVVRISGLGKQPGLHLLLAPAFLGIILGGVLIERAYKLRYPSILLTLGDASYSIYLVHSAVISAVVLVSEKLGLLHILGVHIFFLVTFVTSVIGGTIAYFTIEKPLTLVFKRFVRHKDPA